MSGGRIVFPVGAGLAPMAGVTSLPFRILSKEQGAAWTVTEMLSAKGFLYAGRNLRAVRDITCIDGEKGITGLQLFGREPELLAEAANQLSGDGFAFIDINMGCPAHKIVGNGEGSALMKEPELVGKIVRAVANATKLPVTVKIRSGWDAEHINAPLVAKICEDNGAVCITVHARTRMQQYSGKADRSVIRAVAENVSIPVIGNGDIDSGESALSMLRETGCAGIMVGRAAMGNPWIFAEIRAALQGEHYERPNQRERVAMAIRHMEMMVRLRGEDIAIPEMRSHIAWYIKGGRNSAQARNAINHMTSMEQVREALENLINEISEQE